MKGLLFFDIDGTLVDSEHGCSMPYPSSIEAIHQAQKNGYLCFLASGRNYAGLSGYVDLGFDGMVFSDGGGIILKDGRTYLTPIPEEIVKEYMDDAINNYSAEIILATKDALYASEGQYEEFQESAKQAATYGNATSEELFAMWHIHHLEEYDGQPVIESDISFPNEKVEKEWESKKHPFLEYVSTSASYGRGDLTSGEVTYQGVTKGNGCKRVAEISNVSLDNTFAFGDSMNDASMIRTCGVGIAMGNAAEELKEMADYITDDVDKEGLLKAMLHFHIIEE